MLPPGLEPPPRLEAEWTARKSWEGAGLEGRTRDDDAAEAEVLDKPACPQGSMTVLMTEEETICPQYGKNRNLTGIYRDFTLESFAIYPQVAFELSWAPSE